MAIKKLGIAKGYDFSYKELKENNVVSQGWEYDVSFLYKAEMKEINEWLPIFAQSDNRSRNAFKQILKEISKGDIILAFEGNTLKGICEIPQEFIYYYDESLKYKNCLYPVIWVDWEHFCPSEPSYEQGGQGVQGIVKSGIKINDYINENWENYKKEKNISLFPEECKEKYEKLKLEFPQKQENSKKYLESIKFQLQKKAKMEDYKYILEQKHQIIFTGAPGTGKTYLAREIAKEMVKNETIRTNFVQFHPSYDYADFVEGLRPIMKGDNQLGFELKNGTFKDFCRKAGVIERLKFAKKEITDENIKEFLNVDENHELFTFWKDYKNTEIKDLPKFVFLIDEINRAEISKVFGELFFSIDVGYRGEKGKIKTQYANMQNENTFFVNQEDDYFFVPSNVYIIGTMNDIDRSVEMFDFAMRRRFAWEEIKVSDTLDSILDELQNNDLEMKAKAKINALNDAISGNKEKNISGIEGLNSSYHIGGAYFLKLNDKKDIDVNKNFENLWTYHLETLLKEYLRGLPEAEGKLNKLKEIIVP